MSKYVYRSRDSEARTAVLELSVSQGKRVLSEVESNGDFRSKTQIIFSHLLMQ